MTVLKWVRMT